MLVAPFFFLSEVAPSYLAHLW